MKWFLAGNRGLVGTNFSSISRCSGVNTSTCNLEDYQSTLSSLQLFNPTHVMINAASVGGLMDDINNSFDLYIKNLTIQSDDLITKQIVREFFLKQAKTSINQHLDSIEGIVEIKRELDYKIIVFEKKKKDLRIKLKKL